ncbi:hypothetical protein B0H11DRAFT_2135940 [Mycena galericulata]|nr:hypothetical protein B0H11DRAFT_2135940 [Mycena galericulata]
MDGLYIREETGAPPFVVFDVLQFLALLFLMAMLLPALLSRSVQRMKTWFNLIIACIIYCVSFLLLVGHQSGPEPPFALCVFQAGLIYAAPPGIAAAGLAFVVELYLKLSSTLSMSEINARRIIILLVISPLAHFIVFWVAVFTGLSGPVGDLQDFVQRSDGGLYCHINSKIPTTVTAITVVFFVVMMFIVEVYTIVYLVRKRSAYKGIRLASGAFPLSLFIRTASYSSIGGLAIILVYILNSSAASSSMQFVFVDFSAILPLTVALVFGFHMDIIRFYMCWRTKKYQNADRNLNEKV